MCLCIGCRCKCVHVCVHVDRGVCVGVDACVTVVCTCVHVSMHPFVQFQICKICIHLVEVCGGSDMVARAELHTKILAIIFSGVLKLTLDSIEDSRRDREPVCIPKLAAFMQYLSTGSGEDPPPPPPPPPPEVPVHTYLVSGQLSI